MIGNYIKAVAAAVSRSTAKLMKTGQTMSYRTGDDGDLESGRNVDFFFFSLYLVVSAISISSKHLKESK